MFDGLKPHVDKLDFSYENLQTYIFKGNVNMGMDGLFQQTVFKFNAPASTYFII